MSLIDNPSYSFSVIILLALGIMVGGSTTRFTSKYLDFRQGTGHKKVDRNHVVISLLV